MDLEMHKVMLDAVAKEDPEKKKNRTEIEKMIKDLEADAKKPKSKKPSEMSLGEADEVVSKQELEKFAGIFKKLGGKIIQNTGRKGDSVVIEFPANKEATVKKVNSQIMKGAKGRFESVLRKESGKVFLTFRRNR